MAPQVAHNKQQGSALFEAIPVFLLLTVLVSGLLLATYLLFARVWIQWRCEQALYCMAVEQRDGLCRHQLTESVQEFLPWGESHFALFGGNGRWNVEGQWRMGSYYIQIQKSFDTRSAATNRDLRL